MTTWLVVRHADLSANEILYIIKFNNIRIIENNTFPCESKKTSKISHQDIRYRKSEIKMGRVAVNLKEAFCFNVVKIMITYIYICALTP